MPPSSAEIQAIGVKRYLYTLRAGTELWRIYSGGGPYAVKWSEFRHWGPNANVRFDHHLLDATGRPHTQERGILYTATAWPICVAEYFQSGSFINRYKNDPWLVSFALSRDVVLLNLRGLWPTRAGASMSINSGPRAISRAWSATIYEAFPQVEGLWYSSKMHRNDPAIALYERAEDALPDAPRFHRKLTDIALSPWLESAARKLNYRLGPRVDPFR